MLFQMVSRIEEDHVTINLSLSFSLTIREGYRLQMASWPISP